MLLWLNGIKSLLEGHNILLHALPVRWSLLEQTSNADSRALSLPLTWTICIITIVSIFHLFISTATITDSMLGSCTCYRGHNLLLQTRVSAQIRCWLRLLLKWSRVKKDGEVTARLRGACWSVMRWMWSRRVSHGGENPPRAESMGKPSGGGVVANRQKILSLMQSTDEIRTSWTVTHIHT